MLKIGVVSSSNGGAFKTFYKLIGLQASQVVLITDRPCGIEQFAVEQGINHKRIETTDNDDLSEQAKSFIDEHGGVDVIFLFYTRLITESLFEHYLAINFHPSLLPAFRGFAPTKRALSAGVKYFGTTAHVINENADEGKIIGQSCIAIASTHTVEALERVSFVQKVYQMALIFEMLEAGSLQFNNGAIELTGEWPISMVFNPALKSQETLNKLIELDKKNETGVFKL